MTCISYIIINVFWLNKNKKKETSFLLSVADDPKFLNNLCFKKPNEIEEEEKSSCAKENIEEKGIIKKEKTTY